MTEADLIIHGIDWLITVDTKRRILRDAAVAIKDGKFADVGKTADILKAWTSTEFVDAGNRVATPGLIDSHLHSSFQLARGLADEVGTRPFLFEHMFPYEGAMSADDVYVSSLFTTMSLLRCGVTCFIDPGNYHPRETGKAALAAGMRAVLGRSAFDMTKAVLGILPEAMIETTEQAITNNRALLDHIAELDNPKIRGSVSFRGLSNSSDALITACHSMAREHDCMLQTHACFNYSTHDDCLGNFGLPEIERLEKLGVLDEHTLLVHAGWIEPKEIEIIARRRPQLVSAPSSSLHNGYGNFMHGRLPELMEMGINVGLGSDHACSGITDLVQEMLLFAGVYKEIHMNPRVMSPELVVEMATINGARCAGQADSIGSVEVGKEADIVLFDSRYPEWQPLFNPVSNLVYSATGNSVTDVWVAGDRVVENSHLSKVDEAQILAQVASTMDGIGKKLNIDKLMKLGWPVS
jgi:5-methylthioadenosine/S-adenosylhomocysteine deaminase